jgi:hypothetical protein
MVQLIALKKDPNEVFKMEVKSHIKKKGGEKKKSKKVVTL